MLYFGNIRSMKSKRIFFIIALWLSVFTVAEANVRVNEVAWMGTTVSGTNEWIELFNEGDTTVDFSGWSIVAYDGSPSITLTGSIAPRGYFLIERTDDTTVPDIAADQVVPFDSGLANSGETLYLKDGNGVTIDTVNGGEGWINIGGDNSTKETAQYTASGWVTGTPTPRTANVSHGVVLVASTKTSSSPTSSASSSTPSSSSTKAVNIPPTPTYPRKEISVFAGDDKNALTYTSVIFSGVAYGLYDEQLSNATYQWNFGDGEVGGGREVTHTYRFPGEYTVVLEVFWGKEHKKDSLITSVVAPGVALGEIVSGTEGFIELVNHSQREVELSLWQLHTPSGMMFIIPRNTFIAAGQSVRFPNKITNLLDLNGGLELSYPDGIAVSTSLLASEQNVAAVSPQKAENSLFTKATLPKVAASVTESSQKANVSNAADDASASVVLWQGNKEDATSRVESIGGMVLNNMQWIFLLLCASLVIFAGFVISRGNAENSIASEYTIIEDIIESEDDLKEK